MVSFDFIINLTDFVHFNKTSYRNCLFFFFSAFREPQTMFEYGLTAQSKLTVIVLLFFINARDPTSLIKP